MDWYPDEVQNSTTPGALGKYVLALVTEIVLDPPVPGSKVPVAPENVLARAWMTGALASTAPAPPVQFCSPPVRPL
jgi:hypothetical protein